MTRCGHSLRGRQGAAQREQHSDTAAACNARAHRSEEQRIEARYCEPRRRQRAAKQQYPGDAEGETEFFAGIVIAGRKRLTRAGA